MITVRTGKAGVMGEEAPKVFLAPWLSFNCSDLERDEDKERAKACFATFACDVCIVSKSYAGLTIRYILAVDRVVNGGQELQTTITFAQYCAIALKSMTVNF